MLRKERQGYSDSCQYLTVSAVCANLYKYPITELREVLASADLRKIYVLLLSTIHSLCIIIMEKCFSNYFFIIHWLFHITKQIPQSKPLYSKPYRLSSHRKNRFVKRVKSDLAWTKFNSQKSVMRVLSNIKQVLHSAPWGTLLATRNLSSSISSVTAHKMPN